MVLLACVVITGILLGAGRSTWSLGVISCMAGLAMICAPPKARLPKIASLSLLMVMAVPLLGLLPVSWFGGPADWRSKLTESWSLYLPQTLSPDPHGTFECWLVMMVMLLWLWTCLGQKGSDDGRRWCIYTLAFGGALVAALSWIDYSSGSIAWWSDGEPNYGDRFGPFSNRNHSSSLSAISTILCAASAYDAYRRRSKLSWFFAILFWVPFSSIFVNTSRGGLGLLFMGLIAWVTTVAMKKGFVRKIAVGAAVLLVVASVATVSSGRLGSRLRAMMFEQQVSPLTSSLRFDLAKETLALVTTRPLLGQGFDTFVPVFPLVSNMEMSRYRFMHPESDLLLLLFEGGLLATVPCVVLLFWIGRSTGGWGQAIHEKSHERPGRRLRQAAAIAAAMALVHSIFDVPNHGVGYGLSTALLLGLSIRPRRLKVPGGWIQAWAFRLAGVAVIAVGIMWWGIGTSRWTPEVPTANRVLRDRISTEVKGGRYREALMLSNRTIQIAPLDYKLYYLRAQLLLLLRQEPERALLDFGRSRALEPRYANTCYKEGEYWLGFVPELAMIPWRECLRRRSIDPALMKQTYASMLGKAMVFPELKPPLWGLAESTEMQLTFLMYTRKGEDWEKYLAKFLEAHPKLEILESKDLRLLMRQWHQKGDRHALVQLLEENPSLQSYGWRTMCAELALEGRYEEAYFVASKFMKRQDRPMRIESNSIQRLERIFVFNSSDMRSGIELYYAKRASGDLKGARATAEKVVALPDAPAYMKLELAYLHAELMDFRRAWEMMELAMLAIQDV
ncbi:O-antigen ligase-like membrane protein [Prosthecobacter fusiformis]|uniref:O-antigen ligase-like membrane protein n=2 Tax=Prosthecobacter fusiformis TaxID=48464 RepID=A0A4R7RKE9_9BACT|nr:O-antigen ligase-like membrane protein [Prosthecobacter fusiformis]